MQAKAEQVGGVSASMEQRLKYQDVVGLLLQTLNEIIEVAPNICSAQSGGHLRVDGSQMSHSLIDQELETSRSIMTIGETQTDVQETSEAGIQTKRTEFKDCDNQTTPTL